MKKPISIIYIDDEADTEKFASKIDIMRDEGINVKTVTKVDKALPLLRKIYDKIDIIILDIIMPPEEYYSLQETNGGTATGLRLLEDIRKEFPEIPIMIVSIRRKEMLEDLLSRLNIVKYLEKPVLAYHLVSAIKDALSSL
jgi:CheY-like chemotaxis protein